jgi:hypothetical protein
LRLRFWRLRLTREHRLLAGWRRPVGEQIPARQGDAALPREPLDELASDDLFDRARGALHLDPMIALEQRHHFLAGGVEQLRDFVDPNCCH